MEGWVKLHRKLYEKSFYSKDSEKVHLWIHLLIKANHKEKEEFFNGKIIKCNPGQFTTGRKQLSNETGISESKIQRILAYFEKIEQQIEQETSSSNRLISIVNWNEYQESEQQIEQQVNSDRTTSEQQVNSDRTHYKNERMKEVKNERNNNNKEFKNSFLELGVENDIIDDWLKVRKLKKAANTQTAFKLIKKQIELSGLTANECIKISVGRSWSGFNAEWIKKDDIKIKSHITHDTDF